MTPRRICVLLAPVLLVTAWGRAQDPARARWPLTDPAAGGTGGAVLTEGRIAASPELLRTTEINQYTGYNASQRVRMAGTNNTWPPLQTAPIDSVHIEFSVRAPSGFTLRVDSLSLRIGAHSTTHMKAHIAYSTDSGFASPVAVPYVTGNPENCLNPQTSPHTPVGAAPGVTLGEGERLLVRVYPWLHNQSTGLTGKYVCVQEVVIAGAAFPIPAAASATWPLTSSQSALVTGLLEAGDQVLMGLTHDSYGYHGAGGGPPNCDRITPPDGTWPAEPLPNPARYVQYGVRTPGGVTLAVSSVSCLLGARNAAGLRAEIRASRDSAFGVSSLLTADAPLDTAELALRSFALTDTISPGSGFYLRVLPHGTVPAGPGSFFCAAQVTVAGTTTGSAVVRPGVTTVQPGDISTTSASGGGNVSSDGGSAVTERGVCWSDAGVPTVQDPRTSDGTGTGPFASVLSPLNPGTLYHVRAYATNAAGTAYGEDRLFATLAALVPPTVVTGSVTGIMATTAQGTGAVTAWGGDTVTERGLCWNTTGGPTTGDRKIASGGGTGSFTAMLSGLLPGTPYHVRAYAVNSIGTGYGNETSFTTQIQAPSVTRVVAQDSSGDYTTVQAAFNDVPPNYTGTYTILVRRGVYYEKLLLGANRVNVVLLGEHRDSTILTYDDYSGRVRDSIVIGTSTSYSVAIDASDFTARNLTIRNTATTAQAVALRTNGDRQAYYDCNILGYQDTYYAWGGSGTGRIYNRNCRIRGSVDFIFGRNIVLFDSCTVHVNRNGGTLTAASTEPGARYGLVFRDCVLEADSIGFDGNPITSFYLGRPWQAAPRTVFLRCREPAVLHPAGWLAWNVAPALYGEHACTGPGYRPAQRVPWSVQLGDSAAALHTPEDIFGRNAVSPPFPGDWVPPDPPPVTGMPEAPEDLPPREYGLNQNYPNPFNGVSLLEFRLAERDHVRLSVFDVLGREVARLTDAVLEPGLHRLRFDGSGLSSGTYFSRLRAGGTVRTRKMMLLK
ncbi:MAG: pectinesterase family protein [Bacteroidota bacterium]